MNNNTGRLPSFPESVMLTGPVKSNTKPNTLNHVPPINPIRSDHVGKPQEGSMMLPSLNEVMKPIFTDNVNMYKQMPSISSFQKQNPSGTHSPTSSPTLPPPNRSGPPSLPGGMPSGMSMGNLPLPSLMNSLPKHQSPMNPHQNTNSPSMGSHQSHQHQGNPPSMNSQHHSHQNNGPQMSPHQSHQHQGNSMGTHQHQNNSSMNSHQHQGNAPIGSQHSHQQNNQSMGNMGHPNNNPSSPMSGHPHNSHNPLLALTHPHTNPMALQNKSNNSNGNNNNNNNNINNTNIPINSQPKKQNLYIMNDRNQIEFDRSGVAAPPPLSYGPPGMPMSTQLPYPNNMPMMPNKPNPSNPNYQEQLQEAKRISDNMKANVRGYLDSNATTKKRKTGSDAPETPQPTILSDSRTSAFSPMKKRETHPTVSNNASSEDLSPQEPDRGKLADEQTNFAHLLQNNFSGVNLSNDSCGELLEIYRNFHKNENAKLIPPVPARADLKVENK